MHLEHLQDFQRIQAKLQFATSAVLTLVRRQIDQRDENVIMVWVL